MGALQNRICCDLGLDRRVNMIRIRQSRPDAGLLFQVKVPKNFLVVASSLGGGKMAFEKMYESNGFRE